jgi:Rhodopirellula transposase DDE domain
MCVELTKGMIATLKDAAAKMTGAKRRAFQAQVATDYLHGSPRQAERVFGWGRQTVETGLHELRTGIECVGDFTARGNKKLEEKLPKLEHDIRALAEPHSQQDPEFQSPFLYTRMTAAGMRKALIEEKGWTSEQLPHVNTIGEILNRLGFKLRRVQKTKPLKKVRETDAIFQNVLQENRASDARPDSLRISIDSKAKLDLGEFSRGGVLRAATATKALDHDTQAKKNSCPSGFWMS